VGPDRALREDRLTRSSSALDFGDDADMNEVSGRVAWIAIAPVKSMALLQLDHARLEQTGIAGDRAYAVVDAQGRLVNGKRIGAFMTIHPEVDAATGRLTLRFPGEPLVSGDVVLGEEMTGLFFGEPRPVRPLIGPWSEALSAWAHQDLRLVAPVGPGEGIDRGPTATLLSTAALATLAHAAEQSDPIDGRRFRMTFGIDDVPAFAEDGWIGRDVRVGTALIRPIGNVGRCAVTTKDPDTGVPTFDTLGILQRIRGTLETTEPLPCGVVAEIVEPGEVRLGDPIGPV
jgi:uncharacterized protein YcbX